MTYDVTQTGFEVEKKRCRDTTIKYGIFRLAEAKLSERTN